MSPSGSPCLRFMRKHQEVELLVGNALASPMLDRGSPTGAIASIHLESSIVVDHDHVIAPPEMGVPAPRLERRLYALDVRCAARYPVDVPETHRSLVVAQNLVRRNPGAPDLQPVDDSRILEALTDHASVKPGFFMRRAEFGAVQRVRRAPPRRFACVLLHHSPGTRAGTSARYAR